MKNNNICHGKYKCLYVYLKFRAQMKGPRFHIQVTCKRRYAYGTLLRCNRLADLIKPRLRLLSWCAWHHCGLRRRNLGTGEPPGNYNTPSKGTFEVDFPFRVVGIQWGYVSFLEKNIEIEWDRDFNASWTWHIFGSLRYLQTLLVATSF